MVPLIGLYTGMRLEEICQLHTEDIYEEDGIWAINIRTESTDGIEDKNLKTKNAARIIPIHPDLIYFGLVTYRDKIAVDSNRLFPELNKTENTHQYGKQVGKQFKKLITSLEIEGNKTFHSLRHTFSDYFKRMNLHNDISRQIFGHEAKELAARQYGSPFPLKQCYDELISKIQWNK